ncbi:Rab family GTPase [Pseudofulvibacter geojedonensis]|uniref:Rab family GTPase n=1 Tax=Pseudofulvibacter geojedonensis TaxID=1123758 RepID=A0ABW3I114_9FLAO
MTLSKKIVLLGHFGVGKTSIIRKFVTNEFSTDYKVTIGVHILKKEVELPNQNVSLIIWDLEGTDNIDLINKSYLLGAHGFIYVYDVTRPVTFSNLKENVEKLKQQFTKTTIKTVGNKIDLLENNIKSLGNDELIALTDVFSSAKTGDNIEELFKELTQDIIC